MLIEVGRKAIIDRFFEEVEEQAAKDLKFIEKFKKGEDIMELTFKDLLGDLLEIHDRKNHDYAGASSGDPLDNFKKVGERVVCEHCHKPVGAIIAVQVLRATKSVRLENLALRGEPENEGVEDSLKDEAVYALLEIMLRHEQNNPGEIKDDF